MEEAYKIPAISTAVYFCRLHQLKGVELLLRVDGPEFDLLIPMGDAASS